MSNTARRHGGHAPLLLAAALLASLIAAATAQAPNDDYMSGQQVHVSTAMVALLAAVIAVFLFIACATIYLRHCTAGYAVGSDLDGRAAAVALDRHTIFSRSRSRRRPRGLDADVVRAFPTMRYAEAKALRVGSTTTTAAAAALECAVCLSEFEDAERLTLLLPKCSHAFHPDCIGQWLAGHVTCPVCRCNLDPNHKDSTTATSDEHHTSFPFPAAPPPQPHHSVVSSETTSLRDDDSAQHVAVVIDAITTAEEEEEERVREAMELEQIANQRRRRATRLARAHSTGHSLADRLDRDMERFTLRLPDHVRREMVAASEHTLLQQQSLLRGRRAGGTDGGGEGSSVTIRGGGRSGPLAGRAARWQSLLVRTFSGTASFFSASRVTVGSDGGEVSSTSSARVRGKRVAAVDAGDDVSGKGGFVLRLDRIGGGGPSGAKSGTVTHEAAPEVDEEKAVTRQVRT
ncbi:hypothetical protein PR202_gb09901 [Eleusine coracana subsp. coracana]|uniref:RING-type E3 ubiquitin transferase n=1 Tax=Eleusine coracana subsp. coracana TaxID=191504 RepID=A0AAV5EIC8_ELECO|nr:hypothetical protein QOZ80_2BG0201980 [Eleusine coracana subsp. coracana]GJN22346.1 hypothetical protein PR202_gb09901 [Eleusine coracana subsp. coracana]